MKILQEEWDQVEEMATEVARDVSRGVAWTVATKEILTCLFDLRKTHGDLPEILSSLGDFVSDTEERLSLYEKAYQAAKSSANTPECVATATSATRCCIETHAVELPKWRARLLSLLEDIDDDWEREEANALLNRVKLSSE